MKKLIIILIIFTLTCFSFSKTVKAAPSATPASNTATPTIDDNTKKKMVENVNSLLKQKKLTSKRGIIGTVTNVSETKITLNDLQNNIRFINVDEITKFASTSAKSNFGISDITKGAIIGALGIWYNDPQNPYLLARFIDVLTLPQFINGVITGIDNKNYNLTIATVDKPSTTISIETTTKTYSYTKDADLIRAGFSKILLGERITVIGFTDLQDKNMIIASRVYLFPDLPKNPSITLLKSATITSTPIPTPTK